MKIQDLVIGQFYTFVVKIGARNVTISGVLSHILKEGDENLLIVGERTIGAEDVMKITGPYDKNGHLIRSTEVTETVSLDDFVLDFQERTDISDSEMISILCEYIAAKDMEADLRSTLNAKLDELCNQD